MRRDTEHRRAVLIGHGERAQRELAELGRAVHQVLEIGRGERIRRPGPACSCVATLQRRSGRPLEAHRHRSTLHPARPHQRRRHVDVRMRAVDREVGAVDAVAEDAVLHPHGARVAGDVPLVRVGPRDGERLPRFVGDPHVEDVLRELVDRVAPWRRTAHAHLQRSRRHIGERDVHLHQVVFALREREPIRHRRLRLGRGCRRRRDDDREAQVRSGSMRGC